MAAYNNIFCFLAEYVSAITIITRLFLPDYLFFAVSASRAFYGQCLPDHHSDILVVYQSERVDRRHGLMASVVVAEPRTEHTANKADLSFNEKVQDHLHEWLLERHLPRITSTLELTHSGACTEITGRNRVMPSHPLDVDLRHKKLDDDKDDDGDTDGDTDTVAASDAGTDTGADTGTDAGAAAEARAASEASDATAPAAKPH